MEVSVLEAKRLGHRAVLRLSWLLLVASVALSTLLQVAVAPATLVGYLTAGVTPVWLLGSFAVLSLLYRTPTPALDPAADAGEPSKRQRARQAYAALVAAGQPVTGARLAEPPGECQLRPCPAGRVPGRPHPGQSGQRPGGRGAVAATIWRTCPSCGVSFEQPDDPSRKRVYCSRACQQAVYRARQQVGAGQHSGRQDLASQAQADRAVAGVSKSVCPSMCTRP
jgi:hypothetical protein